jgi:aspartyl-tRNA synthetase
MQNLIIIQGKTFFRIRCSPDDFAYPGPIRRSGAHNTRFESHIQCAIREVFASSLPDAAVKACISAWAVTSLSVSVRLCALAMMMLLQAITAPTGISSFSNAISASLRASFINQVSENRGMSMMYLVCFSCVIAFFCCLKSKCKNILNLANKPNNVKMYRTHTCGELDLKHADVEVTLSGWVQRSRDHGGMTFIDLRDRYGITQLVFDLETDAELCKKAREIGREYVVQVVGKVRERSNKNPRLSTGDIEIEAHSLNVLNPSVLPPFTIEDETDGGEELRMKFRYLDLRRKPMKNNLMLRHRMAVEIRKYLDKQSFIEIETPVMIKSTPEGARDFVVPSRMNKGEFYALPQSPQIFKQLLMVAGYDKYFQIVKCFRDEDLRADRQPEFTQVDCEMTFAGQEDVLSTFEGLIRHLFQKVKNIIFSGPFPRISFSDAMDRYGTDKPDIRFGMELVEITGDVRGYNFPVFEDAAYTGGICAEKCASWSRKQIDQLTEFVKKPQIGARGLVYVRFNEDGTIKSSVDKFYSEEIIRKWIELFKAGPGDLLLILAGDREPTQGALSELRLELSRQLHLIKKGDYAPLWVIDFPLFEWDGETGRLYAKHHPFTSPKPEDISLLDTDPVSTRANAYDLVINGVEIGGGSVRIHEEKLQKKMFEKLGFTDEQAKKQFGFLMEAFRYGAPPHAGIAFGFDRWVTVFAGCGTIRDVIAFPKNNSGRDLMIDSPSGLAPEQLKELGLKIDEPEK